MFYAVAMPLYGFLGMLRRYKSSLHFNWYKVQAETFAKFLSSNSRNLNKDFRLFLFQISTDSTQYPLNPPWVPD